MFTVTQGTPNRLDITIDGKLNSDDMKAALDDLINRSADIKEGRMLYRITNFEFPSLGALAVEFTRIPDLLGLVRKFDKVAVVADKTWIQRVSEIEGALIPGMVIKAFDVGDEAAAEGWLAAKE